MKNWLRDVFRDRPTWMNAVMVFCGFMTFVYLPWDIFYKPVAQDQEVWFGILFTGWSAKAMAIPHWFVYGAGVYGFRRRRPWMSTWGGVYLGQVAFGMWVWSIVEYGGLTGWILGLLPAVPFVLLALAMWNARDYFHAPPSSLRERYGEWGLVTGASAGIGAEFARALAREGVSVVLTARRAERLQELASELEKRHSVATRVVVADLATPEGADSVADAVRDLDIGVLVNNAGVGYSGRFEALDLDRLSGLVQVNCNAPVVLTSRLLPHMLSQGRGAVIIVGSVAGRQPLPLHGVYSATKAFDLLFGESLYVELRDRGVDVLVLEPGSTATEFQEMAGETSRGGEPPAAVVEVALDALGRQPSVVSGWFNWLRANVVARFAPRPMVAYVARDVVAEQTPPHLR
jgi:short-subunit dehydrogenase